MKSWLVRQVLVLLLAVFVTTGMALSAIQVSAMTTKMAVASVMGASGHVGCKDCPNGNGDDNVKAMACGAGCIAPMLAVLPQAAPVLAVQTPVAFVVNYSHVHGRTSSPDPYPPRPTNIG